MKFQSFFADPAMDRMLGMVVQLAAEVQVLADRNRALEGVLREKGLVSAIDVEQWTPRAPERARIEADRELFVRSLLEPVLQPIDGDPR